MKVTSIDKLWRRGNDKLLLSRRRDEEKESCEKRGKKEQSMKGKKEEDNVKINEQTKNCGRRRVSRKDKEVPGKKLEMK